MGGQINEAEQSWIGFQRHAEHMPRRPDHPIENRQARLTRTGLIGRYGGLARLRQPRQLALGQPGRQSSLLENRRATGGTSPIPHRS